jgi:antitoxin HicB
MSKYVYPAVISDDDGKFLIEFPDLKNCFTEGDTLEEAVELAEDVLGMMLAGLEDNDHTLPKPTSIDTVKRNEGDIVTLIYTDTIAWRKKLSTKSVKKTLTIPAWLNTAAEKHGLNYSQLLQEAIMKHVGIK